MCIRYFGSIDANRGDPQLGWDTDQFPNSVEENTLVMYEILKHGGFTTGGLILMRKFADKVLILMIYFTLISVIDVLALSLKRAAKMLQEEPYKNC